MMCMQLTAVSLNSFLIYFYIVWLRYLRLCGNGSWRTCRHRHERYSISFGHATHHKRVAVLLEHG